MSWSPGGLPRYSPSKLLKYIECPAQYHGLYVKKKEDKSKQEPGPIPDAGKIAHKALELVGQKRINKAPSDREPVTKKELLESMEFALRESPGWRDPALITPETVETAARILSNPNCWKKVSFAYTTHVEKEFDQPISGAPRNKEFQEPFALTGIIDRIDEMPDGRIKIVDYKTGWSVMSRAEAELDPQINMYLAAGTRMFPGRQVDIELHYIARGVKLGPIHHSPSREEWLLPFIRAVIWRITKWSKFVETPGMPQCMNCHRRSECVSYEKMLAGVMAPGNRTMGENLESYALLTDIEKAADTGKKTLRKVIREACDRAEDGEVFGGRYKAKLTFANKMEYTDVRRTSIAATRAMLPVALPVEQDEKPLPAEIAHEVPHDAAELAKKFVEITEDRNVLAKRVVETVGENQRLKQANAKLQRAALEIRTAFDVACTISKVQSSLVDDFTEGLPTPEMQSAVGAAVESTSSNAGYYKVDVEQLSDPFYDADPTPEEIAMADAQERETELSVVERAERAAKAAEDEKSRLARTITVEAKPKKPRRSKKANAEAAQVAASTSDVSADPAPQAAQPEAVAQTETPVPQPAAVPQPASVPQPAAVPQPADGSAEKPEWAQPDCKGCGGSGMSSSGRPCSPCSMRHEEKALVTAPTPVAATENAAPLDHATATADLVEVFGDCVTTDDW